VQIVALSQFLQYGRDYDEVVIFSDLNDGISDTKMFAQSFLFGCTFYSKFWVSRALICGIFTLYLHITQFVKKIKLN